MSNQSVASVTGAPSLPQPIVRIPSVDSSGADLNAPPAPGNHPEEKTPHVGEVEAGLGLKKKSRFTVKTISSREVTTPIRIRGFASL